MNVQGVSTSDECLCLTSSRAKCETKDQQGGAHRTRINKKEKKENVYPCASMTNNATSIVDIELAKRKNNNLSSRQNESNSKGDGHPSHYSASHPVNFLIIHSSLPNLSSNDDHSSSNAAMVLGNADLSVAGIGKMVFSETAIRNSKARSVEHITCLDKNHGIYICELGLTTKECDLIISAAEKCAATRGRYNAYTYAKQTLGCRDFDDLAIQCVVPTHIACQTIFHFLQPKSGERSQCGGVRMEGAPTHPTMRLDEREPHIVKYDTAEEHHQFLETHTDKSDWTFLIALSEYGKDYEGGGTYFEATQTAYHLMKGQCLIFKGKLKHCGLKILNGRRFLLVGFLVSAKEDGMIENSSSGGGQ
mmetsp:Transcript_23190/g.33267  ORF Transcript_23190/g.33267 Transcript_23190/m.33267 type:complete len:362 (-) Transcript_23190:2861-3946(-)